MNLTEKKAFADAMRKKLSESELVVLTDYTGMNVETMNALRRKLDGELGAEFHVVKNTLCVRAIQGTDMEVLSKYFVGPTAVLMTSGDPVGPAKVLQEFLKENAKVLKVKAGFYAGKTITAEDVAALSKLPSRDELLAQLLGTLQAPMSQFLSVLAGVPQKFVATLAAYRKELEDKGA